MAVPLGDHFTFKENRVSGDNSVNSALKQCLNERSRDAKPHLIHRSKHDVYFAVEDKQGEKRFGSVNQTNRLNYEAHSDGSVKLTKKRHGQNVLLERINNCSGAESTVRVDHCADFAGVTVECTMPSETGSLCRTSKLDKNTATHTLNYDDLDVAPRVRGARRRRPRGGTASRRASAAMRDVWTSTDFPWEPPGRGRRRRRPLPKSSTVTSASLSRGKPSQRTPPRVHPFSFGLEALSPSNPSLPSLGAQVSSDENQDSPDYCLRHIFPTRPILPLSPLDDDEPKAKQPDFLRVPGKFVPKFTPVRTVMPASVVGTKQCSSRRGRRKRSRVRASMPLQKPFSSVVNVHFASMAALPVFRVQSSSTEVNTGSARQAPCQVSPRLSPQPLALFRGTEREKTGEEKTWVSPSQAYMPEVDKKAPWYTQIPYLSSHINQYDSWTSQFPEKIFASDDSDSEEIKPQNAWREILPKPGCEQRILNPISPVNESWKVARMGLLEAPDETQLLSDGSSSECEADVPPLNFSSDLPWFPWQTKDVSDLKGTWSSESETYMTGVDPNDILRIAESDRVGLEPERWGGASRKQGQNQELFASGADLLASPLASDEGKGRGRVPEACLSRQEHVQPGNNAAVASQLGDIAVCKYSPPQRNLCEDAPKPRQTEGYRQETYIISFDGQIVQDDWSYYDRATLGNQQGGRQEDVYRFGETSTSAPVVKKRMEARCNVVIPAESAVRRSQRLITARKRAKTSEDPEMFDVASRTMSLPKSKCYDLELPATSLLSSMMSAASKDSSQDVSKNVTSVWNSRGNLRGFKARDRKSRQTQRMPKRSLSTFTQSTKARSNGTPSEQMMQASETDVHQKDVLPSSGEVQQPANHASSDVPRECSPDLMLDSLCSSPCARKWTWEDAEKLFQMACSQSPKQAATENETSLAYQAQESWGHAATEQLQPQICDPPSAPLADDSALFDPGEDFDIDDLLSQMQDVDSCVQGEEPQGLGDNPQTFLPTSDLCLLDLLEDIDLDSDDMAFPFY